MGVYRASSNENLFGTSPKVATALQEALTNTNIYPDPDAGPLRLAIAQKLGVLPVQVVVGSGSAELISLLLRAFCLPYPGKAIALSASPTYPLYQMEAEALRVSYEAAPLNSSYEFDLQGLLAKISPSTRLLFISNPNNPTGSYLSRSQLEFLIQAVPPHVVLVLDEAYQEFATAPDYASAQEYMPQRDNLVILRTFSKAYGLASLRVGYMVAQESLLQKVCAVKQPYNVNQLAQVAALAALADEDHLQYTLQQTAAGKVHLQQILDEEGVQWWPSQGNFLLADAGVPAAPVIQHLLRNGVQVRETKSAFAFRITIGKKAQQEHLHGLFGQALSPENIWQDGVLAQILETGYALAKKEPQVIHDKIQALTQVVNPEGSASERIALAYLRAFSACLDLDGNLYAGNLYSNSNPGERDMISAFNVLVRSTPLVTFGHQFANLAILEAVADAREVHVLDLGIGSGLQWLHFLEVLAMRPGTAPSIRITGIDIPAPGGAPDHKLQLAGEMLQRHAVSLGLHLTYTPIPARLEEINLQELDFAPTETLVVNSALTLHHLPDQLLTQPDYRDRILQQIRALEPKVLTLTEPDSEHNRLKFLPRLRESLRHYRTVFDVLDTLLPPMLPERQIIEQEFFGREIINVVSCEGHARVERHERQEAWQQRLIRNGFLPAPLLPLPEALAGLHGLHASFSVKENGAGYSLCWKETAVVAATAWV
ncbi:histidinol-phosphate aminotransferase [Pontibacter ummariensis]|uniref:Histidinol-phosphate aminotransferase n=2 Tax=Pontibacter ummariensis TaxID=1610492 RepID=A0A239D3X9_9BACT|nr:histidinol-phosphate aminotransferase [Pontibacter ummariensis]SNS27105.1 histidinol-phosphate aminotransferase [Pontibacter ummariensis]